MRKDEIYKLYPSIKKVKKTFKWKPKTNLKMVSKNNKFL